MRVTRISRGGQIQVPAEVRRRWGTVNVIVEDRGNEIRVRPVPDDPIGAAAGSLRLKLTVDEMRRIAREDDLIAEDRRRR